MTSPPYGPLKDYGHQNQIGFGQDYAEYLDDMGRVFEAIHTHTKSDGSLWIVADTFAAKGVAPRRLTPLPFDLAAVAEDIGFTLRDVIIWRKDRTLPWSNGARLRNAFEYILLLVKGHETKYRIDRLRDPSALKEWWVRFPERYHPNGKAPENVWDIPIPLQGSWGNSELSHDCPLPPDLIERLVLLSTDPGDVVFDSFGGSGVVLAEASRLGRLSFGCELSSQHVEQYERVVRPEIAVRHENRQSSNGTAAPLRTDLAEAITDLRCLKYARVLMERLSRRRLAIAWPAMAAVTKRRPVPGSDELASISVYFIADANTDAQREYEAAARAEAERAPLSKFGLDVSIDLISTAQLPKKVRGRRVYLYADGQTNRTLGAIRHGDLLEEINARADDRIPPIVSAIRLEISRADATWAQTQR